jgi:hypothetical protein
MRGSIQHKFVAHVGSDTTRGPYISQWTATTASPNYSFLDPSSVLLEPLEISAIDNATITVVVMMMMMMMMMMMILHTPQILKR